MDSLLAFAAPLTLLVPVLASTGDGQNRDARSAPRCSMADVAESPVTAAPINPLSAMRQSSISRQVRIEQRVVVRIAPQSAVTRRSLLADVPQRAVAPRFEERDKEKCVPLDGIAGVQTGSGNRLVLYLRDRRMISVSLEKSCRARDFYSGFYVEKNKDGRLCVDRDKLQSRTGARCEVDTMRQLVQVES
ncbi:hypothetical protein [Erythrobacter sp. R86502]|uniref:hypothetical protein n=1 Tax=Erythrobacter sp. R86502 TaxID=3093846 RepID=UPI0036D23093